MASTFTLPLLGKTEGAGGPGTFRSLMCFQTTVDIAKTGLAAGTTTFPIATRPANTQIDSVIVDVMDPYDATAAVNLQIGITGALGSVLAVTTLNTAGRRLYTPTTAIVSTNSVISTSDQVLLATVSITTSAVTVGRVLVSFYVR